MWEPFSWGTHDCGLFVSGAINAMCGVDPAAAFRGTYTDQVGAATALREDGAGTLLATAASWLGEPGSIHHAKRGDIVVSSDGSLGVCVGRYSWFVGLDQGCERLIPIPTNSCQSAFTVPFGPAEAVIFG